MSIEIFKTIPFASNYKVSNKGLIINKTTGKECSQNEVSKGYLSVYIYRDDLGRWAGTKVHRVVAEMFLDKTNGLVIDHIDNNKHNNNADNLRYVTNRYNTVKQKLYSKGGLGRKKKENKHKEMWLLEYRIGSRRYSILSNNEVNLVKEYCYKMDFIDKTVSTLVREFYSISA